MCSLILHLESNNRNGKALKPLPLRVECIASEAAFFWSLGFEGLHDEIVQNLVLFVVKALNQGLEVER